MKLILITALILVLYFLVKTAYQNTKDFRINKIKINKENTLGDYAPILNILHLSDLHLENISISPDELYDKLKASPVDLIAITGDFLDRKRTIPKLVPYLKSLNKLQPNHGIYAVLGNHDYVLKSESLEAMISTLQENHCRVLINECDTISVQGKRVNIIGIDDFSTNRSQLSESYLGVKTGINLVLTHDPNIVLHMKNYHFDYLLSGHFHGGQICYPKAYHLVKMGKLARMNIIKGLHIFDGKPFYISEGLGQTGVNIRVGSRPEITLHELTLQSSDQCSELAI